MWARYRPDEPWCLVERIDSGSVRTVCRGRWPSEHCYETHANPLDGQRCSGCNRDDIHRRDTEPVIGAELYDRATETLE